MIYPVYLGVQNSVSFQWNIHLLNHARIINHHPNVVERVKKHTLEKKTPSCIIVGYVSAHRHIPSLDA